MRTPSQAFTNQPGIGIDKQDWLSLAGVVALAIAFRFIFFTGLYGSDEVLYIKQALAIANGDWIVTDYVGELRYGVNIPMAFFIKLFGVSLFSAGLWAFLCSVGEVGLVYYFARKVWGLREACFSALVIALLPIHIHHAGRIMADPPLAFFVTLSFVIFYFAERQRSVLAYFIAGVACGFAFWVKELVIIYYGVFAIYALVQRSLKKEWLWMALGLIIAIAANCLLLWAITGNPLMIYHAGHKIINKFQGYVWIDNSALGYFKDMFFGFMSMGVVPFLALVGGMFWARDWLKRCDDQATRYVVIWAGGLLCIFSFTVISISPLKFASKQTNYMLIFAAPLCLLAGLFLARLKGMWLAGALAILLIPAIILPGLNQRSIQLLTSNSKEAYRFAINNPDSEVYAGQNANMIAWVLAMLQFGHKADHPLKPIADILSADAKSSPENYVSPTYVIVDPQAGKMDTFRKLAYGKSGVINGADDLPSCWQKMGNLNTQAIAGDALMKWLDVDTKNLPQFFTKRIDFYLANPFVPVLPAYIYSVPRDCIFSMQIK